MTERDCVEYVLYAITKPTRAGRRLVWEEIYRTRSAAKADFVKRWSSARIGERAWRKRLSDGWRIEPVTVRLDRGDL